MTYPHLQLIGEYNKIFPVKAVFKNIKKKTEWTYPFSTEIKVMGVMNTLWDAVVVDVYA